MERKTYQAKDCFIHRTVADLDVLISVGANIANFNGYVELNESAAFLWDQLKEPKTQEELADALFEAFELERDKADADVKEFLQELEAQNMVVTG